MQKLRLMQYCLILCFGSGRSTRLIQCIRIIHANKEDSVRVVHKIPSGHDPHVR